jgi:hypothetical protein
MDLIGHEDFANANKVMKGGIRYEDNYDDEVNDEDNLYGGYYAENPEEGMNQEIADNMYASVAGGAKLDDDDNTYTIAHSSVGYTGGRYVSKTASGAAKKAGTTIFKIMRGSKKNPARSGTSDKKIAEAFVVLERTRQGKCKKYYAYDLHHIQLGDPKVVKIAGGPSLKYNYKTVAKKADLPNEYVDLNKEAKKKYAAVKKAQKAKDAGEVPKKRKPAASKKTKAAKKTKEATIDEILKSIVSSKKAPKKAASPPKKAPKKPASPPKKPASPPKKVPKKAPKKKTGGGYCSFF